MTQRSAEWYAANALERSRRRAFRYGITPADVDALHSAQGGKCAICGVADPGGKGAWHIDHDHGTGRVRGLLCHGCNVGLGNFRENPEALKSAVAYLAFHSSGSAPFAVA